MHRYCPYNQNNSYDSHHPCDIVRKSCYIRRTTKAVCQCHSKFTGSDTQKPLSPSQSSKAHQITCYTTCTWEQKQQNNTAYTAPILHSRLQRQAQTPLQNSKFDRAKHILAPITLPNHATIIPGTVPNTMVSAMVRIGAIHGRNISRNTANTTAEPSCQLPAERSAPAKVCGLFWVNSITFARNAERSCGNITTAPAASNSTTQAASCIRIFVLLLNILNCAPAVIGFIVVEAVFKTAHLKYHLHISRTDTCSTVGYNFIIFGKTCFFEHCGDFLVGF